MGLIRWILKLFLNMPLIQANDGAQVQLYYATIFALDGDLHVGGPSPCLNRMPVATDNIIAHRSLPCGTKVRITNVRTGKSTVTYVGERGPYGACTHPGWIPSDPTDPLKPNPCPNGYWKVKKNILAPGIWRGAADITPVVGAKIGHNGYELILLEVVSRKGRSQPARKPNS